VREGAQKVASDDVGPVAFCGGVGGDRGGRYGRSITETDSVRIVAGNRKDRPKELECRRLDSRTWLPQGFLFRFSH